jgi:hypothetical protein
MLKLKESHVEEIKHTKALVTTLSRMQDRIYKQLVEDLGLSKHLEGYLFDMVYNSTASNEELDKDIEVLEQRMNRYAEA